MVQFSLELAGSCRDFAIPRFAPNYSHSQHSKTKEPVMRLNLVVLATVIALVSRCTAASAASSTNQINLSKLNQALDTLQNHAGDGNRFLRSAKIVDDSVDDIDRDDDIDNDDEERGGKTWDEKFAKWYARGETADDVYGRFFLEPIIRRAYKTANIGSLKQHEYYQKWHDYKAFLKAKEK